LTTLLKPDGGTVRIAGYDAPCEPDKVRSRIGVAGQSVTMDGYLTALQNMMMIGRLYLWVPTTYVTWPDALQSAVSRPVSGEPCGCRESCHVSDLDLCDSSPHAEGSSAGLVWRWGRWS